MINITGKSFEVVVLAYGFGNFTLNDKIENIKKLL